MCHPHIRDKWNQHRFRVRSSVLVCSSLTGLLLGGTERCCLHTRCCIACVLCCMLHSSPHEVNGWICTSVDRCRRLNTCSRVSNGCAERHRLLYFRSAIPGCSMCITRPAPGWRCPLQKRRPRAAAADGTQLVRVHLLPCSDSSSWSKFICR